MKTFVKYLHHSGGIHEVSFEVSDVSVEDSMNSLLDHWYDFCLSNKLSDAVIVSVKCA